jgi:phosphate-selective porin OprO and OprP
MKRLRLATAAAVALIGASLASRAQAESADNNQAEIALLKQQLRLMEQKLDKLQQQTAANTAAAAHANAKADAKLGVANADAKAGVANANAAYPVKGPIAPSGVVVTMPNNRPTICTADNQNCIAITSRLHFDVGGYNYRPDSAATSPQKLDSGENVRRARIGVIGKFLEDWNYAMIYDFGGSSDGFGGAAAGSLPGGGVSGIEQAYLSYTGLKPFGGKLAIEGGIQDLAWTLDESTSSNDIILMERASPGIIATNIAAGDFRSSFGARWYNDRFWVGSYVTGPQTGALHSASSAAPAGTSEQYGAIARAAGQVVSGKDYSGRDYSLHIGGDAEVLIQPPHNLVATPQTAAAQAFTLSDRPELRIDPTTLVSTAAIAGTSQIQVYGAEAAATYGPVFFQGEYYWFDVERNFIVSLPSLRFQGGYAEASYVLTGETHSYNPATASYSGVVPANPFSLASGGWGAWEIAARYSTINLNDQLANANGIAGGRQDMYTLGLNWYVSRNIRFMLNYLHGDISKQLSPTNSTDTGAKFDAVAMRTQVAF